MNAELPDGWVEETLGSFLLIQRGGSPRPIKKFLTNEPNGLNWIKIGDVSPSSKYITETAERIIRDGLNKTRPVRPGDLLLSNSMSFGRPYILKIEGCIHDGWLVLKQPTDHCVEKELLYHFLRAPQVKQRLDRLAKGTTVRNLNVDLVASLPVSIPPLNEQRRIVEKIEALTEKSRRAKEALDAIPPLLERFRQSVLAAAFRGDLTADWRAKNPDVEPAEQLLARIREERRTRWEEAELAKMHAKGKAPKNDKWKAKYKEPEPVDTTGLPELPTGWRYVSVGQLAWFVKDGPHHSPRYSTAGIPFISGRNVRPEGVDFSTAKFISEELHAEYAKRCLPELGDVLYTKGGTTGIARVNTYSHPFNVWVHVAVLKIVQPVLPFFVQHMLNSPFCYQQAQAFTHGVGNQDLGLTRMVKIALPLPPREEQQQLVERVDEFLGRTHGIERGWGSMLDRATTLDQAILAKAFRGELVPQDPNDEPASLLLERIRAEREAAAPQKRRKRAKRRKVRSA